MHVHDGWTLICCTVSERKLKIVRARSVSVAQQALIYDPVHHTPPRHHRFGPLFLIGPGKEVFVLTSDWRAPIRATEQHVMVVIVVPKK